jgi:hypothetical protein
MRIGLCWWWPEPEFIDTPSEFRQTHYLFEEYQFSSGKVFLRLITKEPDFLLLHSIPILVSLVEPPVLPLQQHSLSTPEILSCRSYVLRMKLSMSY